MYKAPLSGKLMKPSQALTAIVVLLTHLACHGETQVSYWDSLAIRDTYDKSLLILALEKTKPTHGDYRLNPLPYIPGPRRVEALHQNAIPNLVSVRGYSLDASHQALRHIHFPVELGALGWRICFVHRDNQAKIAAATTLKELTQYNIIQGAGWSDNDILRANGFKVLELIDYSNLIKMVAGKRADLFCRGFNELPSELDYLVTFKNITYDQSFVLVYKMPLFFYLNKENEALALRLEQGLAIAYKDGSIHKLWLEYFKTSIEFSKFPKRKIFLLENPNLKSLNPDFEKFLVDPRALPHRP